MQPQFNLTKAGEMTFEKSCVTPTQLSSKLIKHFQYNEKEVMEQLALWKLMSNTPNRTIKQ